MLPNTGPLTDAQRKQALENFRQYIARHGITYQEVARQVNQPRATTIRDLLQGTFTKNSDAHIRTLNMWIEQHARTRAVALQGNFVETGVAKTILAVARLVRENQTMGLVHGPTGIGKTRCAQALHETYVGSILVEVKFGEYHARGLVGAIARELGVRTVVLNRNSVTQGTQLERVLDRLRDSGRLIMIDEAHKLQDGAIEVLRELHDQAGVPILLFATKALSDRLERNADPDRGQLYSRVDVCQPLTEGRDINAGDGKPLYTAKDIKALYNQPPVKLSDDAVGYLVDVANHLGRGSLRSCQRILRNAARRARKRQGLAEGEKVTVTADDLEYAEVRLRRSASQREMIEQRRVMRSA